jgi:Tfp pilus assembly protein PilN
MINLIPIEEKRKKVKDFYFRLVVVFFAMLGFSAFIAAVAILPVYFISFSNKNLANLKLEIQKQEPVPLVDEGSLSVMKDVSGELNIVENSEKNKYSVSQKIINEVVLLKMSDIKISQITYENSVIDGKKVKILGLAPSRERLLLFRRALEDSAAFKSVDLPISNFVKGSNIEFYLSLIPS